MNEIFSTDELVLVEHAKTRVVEYNTLRLAVGGIDTLYAFIMSDSGHIYNGACLESNNPLGTVCGERHAIANMVLQESCAAKIKHLVVADPVPRVQLHGTTPCGTCREQISNYSLQGTTVLCMQYIQRSSGWEFPQIDKYPMAELFPYPYQPDPDLWK